MNIDNENNNTDTDDMQEEQQMEIETNLVPVVDDEQQCDNCGEVFDTEYSDEMETWVYVDCIEIDGQLFHTLCVDANDLSRKRTALEAGVDIYDNNDIKRTRI